MRTVGISGEITALVSEFFQTAGSDVTGSERGDHPLHWLGDALSKGNTALARPRLCLTPGSQQRHLPGSTAGTAGTAQHPFLPQLCGWEMLNRGAQYAQKELEHLRHTHVQPPERGAL